MKKKAWLIVLIVIAVFAGLGTGFYFWQFNQAYHECNVEAGITVTPSDFLVKEDPSAYFDVLSDTPNTRVPGDYNLIIKTKLFKHKVLLHVTDTIAPEAEGNDVRIDFGSTANVEDFVRNISDATEVRFAFLNDPDFSLPGVQKVNVRVTDLGGNSTVVESTLTVSFVKEEVIVEAGSLPPSLNEFLVAECDASFETDISVFDYSRLGNNEVLINVNGNMFASNLRVEDTVAPRLELCDVSAYTGVAANIDRFIVFFDDVTDVTYGFVEEPDFSKEGEQLVSVFVRDAAGNETVKSAHVNLVSDNEPPVISGIKDFTSYTGNAISYKNKLVVTDNNPEGLTVDIDPGNLDINVPGVYEVVYTATDGSGNQTVKSITVTIKGKEYTEEAVYKLADAVLAKIIKPGMTQFEQAYAIFSYVHRSITFYSGHSIKINWIQGAVDAFIDGTGDCYMYACMSKALLIRAGIPNIDIQRIDGIRPTSHYWNLVSIDGSDWLHFDAVPMKDKTQFFLWNKAQIDEYDATHPGYHAYDPTLYPEIH